MYNFYLFLILLTVGKCIKVYLRKDIYKTLLISEEVLLSGVLILILFTIYYKFVERGARGGPGREAQKSRWRLRRGRVSARAAAPRRRTR